MKVNNVSYILYISGDKRYLRVRIPKHFHIHTTKTSVNKANNKDDHYFINPAKSLHRSVVEQTFKYIKK
jgi:hypothetical protein